MDEATTHRHMAAACGLRLHAAGPRTGGDGAAARRLLRLLLRLPRRSPRLSNKPWPRPTTVMSTSMMITSHSARRNVLTLAGVLQVDSRRAPRAWSCRATSDMQRTSCARTTGVDAPRAVSVDMSGSGGAFFISR